jgi:hypothetical protein
MVRRWGEDQGKLTLLGLASSFELALISILYCILKQNNSPTYVVDRLDNSLAMAAEPFEH